MWRGRFAAKRPFGSMKTVLQLCFRKWFGMSRQVERRRRLGGVLVVAGIIAVALLTATDMWQTEVPATQAEKASGQAAELLKTLPIKGRAAKTGYERSQFGDGWKMMDGCDMRNIILHRDLSDAVVGEGCRVLSGTLNDPYTGRTISFERGASTSAAVQIDHVVALSDAWQKGAQLLSVDERKALANDPLELLAVDGAMNQEKGAGDAATWLPPNKAFRCQYVARQIAVKAKYNLWVTQAEHDAMSSVLAKCPGQPLPQAAH